MSESNDRKTYEKTCEQCGKSYKDTNKTARFCSAICIGEYWRAHVCKSFKYRLYLTKEQVAKLERVLSLCRELYNAALDERKSAAPRFLAIKSYGNAAAIEVEEKEIRPKQSGELPRKVAYTRSKSRTLRPVSQASQSRTLTEIKHDLRPEYQEINDHILRNVLERVDLAFQGFFRRVRNGETPGYPRFKGKNRYDSFTTDNGFKFKPQEKRVTLQNIGSLKIKLHRKLEGTIKTVTIKREIDQWYVIFSCEVENAPRKAYTDEVLGIDVGVENFAALSTGELDDMIANPRYYRKAERKLEQRQKKLSALEHKKKRFRRREENKARAKRLVAKAHRKIANQRRDFLHKQSRQLVNTYDTLVFEDLQIANMVRRPEPKQDEQGTYIPNNASAKGGLNKSILDAGWGMFRQMCTYKAEEADRQIILVDPKNTSQTCSGCGAIVAKALDERVHTCPHCGLVLARDINSARLIRALGMKAHEGQSVTNSELNPSQVAIEAGSASAFALPLPPKRKKAKRAAESVIDPSLSQVGLWSGP